ncbi:Glycerol-3-phosphate acyltransferase [Phytophthora palmivora]|uniref:Glycerol-3-phosphate acyltransferase n=1 Tax=Phytophthora palmivora TaxID=4796 RepID=A0A2P4XX30_9STRA|nr:Glycerol-3-phosphate acyltransferase [Phytophthora palmivora]
MLKPMGKKHLRRDEWRAPSGASSGVKLPAHLRPLLVPNGAALRLQLRYQKYQEKVRTLLKKADASQQQEHAAKAGRVVTTSSMALAVAIQARKEDESTAEQTKSKTPLHLKHEISLDKWSSKEQDWTLAKQTEAEALPAEIQEVETMLEWQDEFY